MSKPKLVQAQKLLKLDLGCAQNPKEGFTGVDLHADADVKMDLLKYPWPWDTSSVTEIYCSHFIEHIPATDTSHNGKTKDGVFAFFDECWRILEPGGLMTVIVPNARSNRAFQDPTHRRFIVSETFLYLSRGWRESTKLDHYQVECNYDINIGHTMDATMSLLHPEAQARRFTESWNVIHDWIATLKAVK